MISTTVQGILAGFVPKEHIFFDEPLKKHTTFHVGGEADCLIQIETEEEFCSLLRYLDQIGIPFLVLGNGSNLLVSDRGYRGIVLKTKGSFDKIRIQGERVMAQAGALLSQVAAKASEEGLTGLEFAAGIPGSAGGAVVMNAGAYGGEMAQVVEQVRVANLQGEILTMNRQALEFKYRGSSIRNHPFYVTEVTYALQKGNREQIRNKMEELAQARRKKQPLEFPSAGSTFKRPEGYFAGKLIMDAGFRGYSLGGAQVSEKHCGFIVNKGNATAQDISDLMDEVSEGVYEKFGVRLEPEVIRVGNF